MRKITVVTHALAPVLVASTVNAFSLKFQWRNIFTLIQLFTIRLAGIIPDLPGIHFSLQGRYSSWTHTIWFVIDVYPVCLYIARNFFISFCYIFLPVILLLQQIYLNYLHLSEKVLYGIPVLFHGATEVDLYEC